MSQPDPILAQMIAQFEAQLAGKDKQLADRDQQLASRDQALARAELKIRSLEERLRLERIARYGKRSETLSDLQLELLDLEPGVSREEVEAESQREPLTAPPARQPTIRALCGRNTLCFSSIRSSSSPTTARSTR